jgi:hypothetical protein
MVFSSLFLGNLTPKGVIRLTTQITAVFHDRDGADLALMRLRRNGIAYSIGELTVPERQAKSAMPLLSLNSTYGLTADHGISAGEMYSAVLHSRAVMERNAASSGSARLTLNVRADQVLRAREIIGTANGRVL